MEYSPLSIDRMRKWMLICLQLLIGAMVFAQSTPGESDLIVKVDSIIKYEIGYVVDSTTNQMPNHEWDGTKPRGLYPSFSSLPANPMTLILLNNRLVEIEDLRDYKLEDVTEIRVFPMNDKAAMALYGYNARNGIVIISLT